MYNGIQGVQGETGNGIASIVKTSTVGLVDTYTITYTDGTTTTFDVTNGQDGDVTEEQLQDVYEQMSSELENNTLTGESIDTSDSAYWKCGITPKGNTFQQTYDGRNLLDISYYERGGISDTTGENATQGYSARGSNYIEVEPSTQYILSANTVCTALRLAEYDTNKGFIIRNQKTSDSSYAITTSATTKFLRWTVNYDNSTAMTEELARSLNFQIEKNSSASSWEPYVGGTASPNPSYPQTVHVVSGQNNVKITNKNLFNFNDTYYKRSATHNSVTISGDDLTFVNSSPDVNGGILWNIPVVVGKEITISYDEMIETSTSSNNRIQYWFSDNPVTSISSTGTGTSVNKTSKKVTVTTTNSYLIVMFRTSNSNSYTISNVQVEYGEDKTDYIQHAEQNYPITLPTGMEIAKIPNTNYIDEIDIKNKKLIKKTQKIDSYNGETITTDYISTTGGLDIGATVYYGIASTEIPITDTTLINQLNQIENAKTYQGITHITQTNADLPFILTLDYKKSNLLRIKALENA